jgi:hypothetical protein
VSNLDSQILVSSRDTPLSPIGPAPVPISSAVRVGTAGNKGFRSLEASTYKFNNSIADITQRFVEYTLSIVKDIAQFGINFHESSISCNIVRALSLLILPACMTAAQAQAPLPTLSPDKPEVKIEHISLKTEDGGLIYADLYGEGDRGVVLAHGGRFTKESWQPQAQSLSRAGFRVIAFDFRGFGRSHGPGDSDLFTAPLYLDVLAAVRYLRKNGAKTVAVMGGSLGGGAAADASIASRPCRNQPPDPSRCRTKCSSGANQSTVVGNRCAR